MDLHTRARVLTNKNQAIYMYRCTHNICEQPPLWRMLIRFRFPAHGTLHFHLTRMVTRMSPAWHPQVTRMAGCMHPCTGRSPSSRPAPSTNLRVELTKPNTVIGPFPPPRPLSLHGGLLVACGSVRVKGPRNLLCLHAHWHEKGGAELAFAPCLCLITFFLCVYDFLFPFFFFLLFPLVSSAVAVVLPLWQTVLVIRISGHGIGCFGIGTTAWTGQECTKGIRIVGSGEKKKKG